jgi:hypothetical protein
MKEAFAALREFFVGASYSVFAAGCVLAVLSDQVTYFTVVSAFVFALLLLDLRFSGKRPVTFTIHISEALLLERAIVVSAVILIFGFISIGGLWLLRRRLASSISVRTATKSEPSIQEQEALVTYVDQIAALARREYNQRRREQPDSSVTAPAVVHSNG